MDINVLKTELATLQAKSANLIDGLKGRNLTDAEATSLQADSNRVMELKGLISFSERNPDGIALKADDGNTEWESFNDDTPVRSGGAKSFIDFSDTGAKSVADRFAAHGIKGIIAAGSSGVPVQFDTRITPLPPRTGGAAGVLSFFEVTKRNSPSYEFLRQKTRTDNAAVVAVGAEKPVSVYEWEKVANNLAVWAHLSQPVDKYLMEDNGELRSYLSAEMRDGLFRKIEANVLSTIAAASGIQTSATAAGYTAAKGFEGVYDALAKLGNVGHTGDLVIVHADDYQVMRLAKDTQNRYFADGPFTGGNPGLWGVNTFIVNSGIAKGTALVLDSSVVGISTDKQGVVLDVNPYTGFSKNELTFRAEGRFAVDVKQPKGVLKLTLTA